MKEGALKMTEFHISVDVQNETDGSATFKAVAREGDEEGEILAIETLEVPYSARRKFGDKLISDDLKVSLEEDLRNRLKRMS